MFNPNFSQKLFVLLLLAVMIPAPAAAQVKQTENERISSVAWSDDGSLVAAVGLRRAPNGDFATGILYVLDMPSRAIRWQTETPNPFYGEPHFSPDGSRLVAARCQFIDIYDSATGDLLHTHFADFGDPPNCVREIDWRADGAHYITTTSEVIVWNAATYEPLYRLNRDELWDAAFQPGGDLIAIAGGGGIWLLPSTLDTDSQPLDRFIITPAIPAYYVVALEWNASGTRLAFTTLSFQGSRYHPSELGVYDLSQQAEILHMSLDTETAYGLDWSSDEQHIATQSTDGRVRVWDVATHVLLAEYASTPRLYSIDAAFSPYGGVLAYGRPPEDRLMSQGTSQPQSDLVGFAVPDPSLARLRSIGQACATRPGAELSGQSVANALAAPLELLNLQADASSTDEAQAVEAFVAQIEALPDETLPLACRADLLAVAEALLVQ
jgi:hypothetical protein